MTTTADRPLSPARRLFSSLTWACAVPVLFVLGAWLAQYPHGLIVVGVIVALATWAVAAILAGGVWHRAGAAVVVSCSGLALTLFAGPGLYELYMKTLGTPAPATVAKVEDRHNRRGAADLYCTVVEPTGEQHVVSEQENCDDHFESLQRVTLRKDPLGLLDPRLPDGPGHPPLSVTVQIAAGLFVLTGATMFYAGRRRRPERRPA
ncbi:hypothetical protein NE236_40505 [Actinoallomurus purpureus]|uniref:hypothetical protein n=1 Tax=Actinoallomurus purpureus TaxID=478114 RepID=UPI0020933FBD|nr:hypothetical protein [Actinoallomurus purpureus]MCO6011250.1 hypothetical protein [Actinoallomurus purpureus]